MSAFWAQAQPYLRQRPSHQFLNSLQPESPSCLQNRDDQFYLVFDGYRRRQTAAICPHHDFGAFGGWRTSPAGEYSARTEAQTENKMGVRPFSRFSRRVVFTRRTLTTNYSHDAASNGRSVAALVIAQKAMTQEKALSPGLALVKLDFLIGTKRWSKAGRNPEPAAERP